MGQECDEWQEGCSKQVEEQGTQEDEGEVGEKEEGGGRQEEEQGGSTRQVGWQGEQVGRRLDGRWPGDFGASAGARTPRSDA